MKKIYILIFLIILFPVSTRAELFVPECEKDYTFAGDRYSIHQLDTDGNIFVGVAVNKIAYSLDFENWTVLDNLEDVSGVYYLKDNFCAVGNGYTYISQNGMDWIKEENNLTSPIELDKSAKLNGSVVAYNGAGTYQTYDAVFWNEVKDVPPGVDIYIVNNKFFMESTGYMRGIYYSDNGESFYKTEIPGYDVSYGDLCIRYYDDTYHVQDFWRPIEDEAYNYHYFSKDLVNWKTDIVKRDDELSTMGSHYININGELHAFTGNGNDKVYRDGIWQQGSYEMSEEISTNPPWVNYIVSDMGILAWSTSHNCYYLTYDGQFKKYNALYKKWPSLLINNGKLCVTLAFGNEYIYENEWILNERKAEDGLYVLNKASNGTETLETEFIERGSWAGYQDNEEITGTITDCQGNIKTVVYENAKDDTVSVLGGNGYYILYGFTDSGIYISKDGITRFEEISIENLNSNILSDGNIFAYLGDNGIIYKGDISQFENIEIEDRIKVCLNDEYLSFTVAPQVESGRTLVPVRFFFERAGATVTWNADENSCTLIYNDIAVKVYIDNNTAEVNGAKKELDVPARLISDKTMLPLRFISEQFGFNVSYDELTHTAFVNK